VVDQLTTFIQTVYDGSEHKGFMSTFWPN